MKRSFALAILLAAAALAAAAQQPPDGAAPPAQVRPLLGPVGSFTAKDTPLSEFCRDLQSRLKDSVVFFVDPTVMDRPLTLTVENITGVSAINLLQAVANVAVTWSSARGFQPVESLYGLDPFAFSRAMAGVGPILLRVSDRVEGGPVSRIPQPRIAQPGPAKEVARVYYIGNILRDGTVTAHDIAAAVESALPTGDPAIEYRVQEDAGLLICQGRAEMLNLVPGPLPDPGRG